MAGIPGQLNPGLKAVRQLTPRQERLVDQVYERIRSLITSAKLAPHERLHQTHFADALGVSRTPVREALLRLEHEGLAYSVPGRGLFVRAVSAKEAADLYEVRLILEPQAARLACTRATERDLAQVERALRRVVDVEATDVAAAFRANREFHLTLLAPCGNAMLLRVLDNVWDQKAALPTFVEYTKVSELASQMSIEHDELATAFIGGSADRVERLVRAHVEEAAARVVRLMEQVPATAQD